MQTTLSLNDLKLKLASLIANGDIKMDSPNDEIRKHIPNVTNQQIEDAIYHLIQDNYYEQEIATLEWDEDFFDGF